MNLNQLDKHFEGSTIIVVPPDEKQVAFEQGKKDGFLLALLFGLLGNSEPQGESPEKADSENVMW